VVLLTPGFITDALGFFVLWPFGRKIIKDRILRFFSSRIHRTNVDIKYFNQDEV